MFKDKDFDMNELLKLAEKRVLFLNYLNTKQLSTDERKNLLNRLLKQAEAHPEKWPAVINNLKAIGAESSVIAAPISTKEIKSAQPAIQQSEPPATANAEVIEKLSQFIRQQKASANPLPSTLVLEGLLATYTTENFPSSAMIHLDKFLKVALNRIASQAEAREEPISETTTSTYPQDATETVAKPDAEEQNFAIPNQDRYSRLSELKEAAAKLQLPIATWRYYHLHGSISRENTPENIEAGSSGEVSSTELLAEFMKGCENLFSSMLSAEEEKNYSIKIKARSKEAGKIILAILQCKKLPEDDPRAKLEALVSQREILTLIFDLQKQEGMMNLNQCEFKGLRRFEFAEKILLDLSYLFLDPVLVEKIQQTCKAIENPKFGEASDAAMAYQAFVSSSIPSQLDSLKFEDFKSGLQHKIKQICERSWGPSDLGELKKSVLLTLMLLTGWEIDERAVEGLNIHAAQFLLEYSSAILGDQSHPKTNRNLDEETKAKTDKIIQTLSNQNNELYELIAIVSEYLQEKYKQGNSPDKLSLLIETIIIKGILNEHSDPGELYDNLAKSGHRKTLFTQEDVLTTILEKFPKERFISYIQKLRAQKTSPADMQDILPLLDERMQLIKEDYTGKKEYENAIKGLISSFPVQDDSTDSDSSPVQTVRIIDSDSEQDEETVRRAPDSPRPPPAIASLFREGPSQNPSVGPDRYREYS